MSIEEIRNYEIQNDLLNKIVTILGLSNYDWITEFTAQRIEKRVQKRFKFYQEITKLSDFISLQSNSKSVLLTEEAIVLRTISKRLQAVETERIIAEAVGDPIKLSKINAIAAEYVTFISEVQKEYGEKMS